jgi:hypothetical protein
MTEQVSQSKTRPTVLFQMWEPFRQSVIEENRFYLEQAKGKLLSQFNDIDKEADAAGERWLEDQAPYSIKTETIREAPMRTPTTIASSFIGC